MSEWLEGLLEVFCKGHKMRKQYKPQIKGGKDWFFFFSSKLLRVVVGSYYRNIRFFWL